MLVCPLWLWVDTYVIFLKAEFLATKTALALRSTTNFHVTGKPVLTPAAAEATVGMTLKAAAAAAHSSASFLYQYNGCTAMESAIGIAC